MNKRQILASSAGVLCLVTGIFAVRIFLFSTDQTPPVIPDPPIHSRTGSTTRLSGPYTHKNLSVYLLHGDDVLKGKTPLTLEEALEQKLVVVHETEEVNELAVENVSSKHEVFIQAGDIVKGGKQDRVLAVDLIVPARSGRLPIDSFCVEQGRWTSRGDELTDKFESSNSYVASKDMKVATRVGKSQQRVWDEIATSQEKLSAATNSNTESNISRSSLPLTLEKPRVLADSGEYIKALSSIVNDKPDVIGFVFTLNGEINSGETYGSSALFLKLWTKLLKATAIEAVAESSFEHKREVPTIEDIDDFLTTSEAAAVSEKRPVTERIRMITHENKASIFIESLDRGTFLHGSYIFR